MQKIHRNPSGPSQRYNVIGSSASGKTTFGRKLAKVLKIPHVELDAIFWGPNWYWPSDEEFYGNLKDALAGDAWVLDGNYTRTTAIKWERVHTVIWLDYSFARTFSQAIRRATKRAWTKEEIWPGTENRESFRKSFFSKDSIILWSVKNFWRKRKRYQSIMTDEKYAHIEFVRLRSPREAEAYLASLENGVDPNLRSKASIRPPIART